MVLIVFLGRSDDWRFFRGILSDMMIYFKVGNKGLIMIERWFGNSDDAWVSMRNKMMYVVGSLFLLVSSFIIGKNPCFYPYFSSTSTTFLLSLRIYQYTCKNWHLYMLDYCYFANILLIYSVFSDFPSNLSYIIYSNGVLMLTSVFTFGNTLTPHMLEYFTTCYMHLNPAIVVFLSKYYGCSSYSCNIVEAFKYSLSIYIFFLIIYSLLIFKILKSYWKKNNVPNMYTYFLNSFFFKIIFNKIPESLHEFCYLVFQVLSFSLVVFSSYFICLDDRIFAVMIFVSLVYAIWRAGLYYLDYLPNKNHKKKIIA